MARIIGTSASETLYGTSHNDRILAGGGNDIIVSSNGCDFIDGGLGVDTVDYSSYKGPLEIVFDANGYATVYGNGVASDTLYRIENLIGGRGDDYFVGNSADNTFWGKGGHDYFVASCGNDTYNGGAGYDTVDFSTVGTGIELKVNAKGVINVWAGPYVYDKLISIENIIGTNFDDILRSGASNDYLRGGAGNDVLISGKGGDVLDGGLGSDILTGGADADIFTFATGGGADTVTDFNAHGDSHDFIDLSDVATAGNYQSLYGNSMIYQSGSDVVIELLRGDRVILQNVDVAHITEDMFIF